MACENRLTGFKPGPHGQNAVTLPLEPPPPMSPVIRRFVDNPKTLFKEVGERKKSNCLVFQIRNFFFIHFCSRDIFFLSATWWLVVNKTIINSERPSRKIYFAPKSFWINHFVSDAWPAIRPNICLENRPISLESGSWLTTSRLINSEISMKRIWSDSGKNKISAFSCSH